MKRWLAIGAAVMVALAVGLVVTAMVKTKRSSLPDPKAASNTTARSIP